MALIFGKFDRVKTRDISTIFYGGFSIFLTLSLWTYSAKDPSFSTLTWSQNVKNACGVVGSFSADLLIQAFGSAACLFPLLLMGLAIRNLWLKKSEMAGFKVVWIFLLASTISGLTALYLPELRVFSREITSGGLVGGILKLSLGKAFAELGGKIILWMAFLILALVLSEQTLQEVLEGPRMLGEKLFRACRVLAVTVQKIVLKLSKMQFFEKDILLSKPSKKAVKKETEQIVEIPLAHAKPEKIPPKVELPTEAPNLQPRKKPELVRRPRTEENWELPSLRLLNELPTTRIKVDEREIRKKAEVLKEKMGLFNVHGEVVAAKPGPVVTMFEFKPEANVKVSKITDLEDDLAMALSAESLRILAPIPGRDVVGIETSNAQRETVYLRELVSEEEFWKEDVKLPIALGKTANGGARIVDLRKMPHLMVAGTTGSGKSVFTVSTIVGLMLRHSPKTLRMILIDPKQVDLAAFEKVPHLLTPVVTDSIKAVQSLKWAVREMEKRYKSMSVFGTRGLEDYNSNVNQLNSEQIKEHEQKNHDIELNPRQKNEAYYFRPLPYLVIIVEEFADLMVTDKANVEISVVKLAQKARACGIHLMICMQSPRKEVVTGLIRTNFSSRIAFKVADAMESRIILDGMGAERLLAQGDMLFKGLGSANLVRHHGPFLSDNEIKQVAKFWSDQGEPNFDQNIIQAIESQAEGSTEEQVEDEYDDRYDQVLSWVSSQKEVSASLIQRRFRLGYPRAARIVEKFEREGVVGPANGSKARQVLVRSYDKMAES